MSNRVFPHLGKGSYGFALCLPVPCLPMQTQKPTSEAYPEGPPQFGSHKAIIIHTTSLTSRANYTWPGVARRSRIGSSYATISMHLGRTGNCSEPCFSPRWPHAPASGSFKCENTITNEQMLGWMDGMCQDLGPRLHAQLLLHQKPPLVLFPPLSCESTTNGSWFSSSKLLRRVINE